MKLLDFEKHFEAFVARVDGLLEHAKQNGLTDLPDIGLQPAGDKLGEHVRMHVEEREVENDPKIMAEINNWECKREEVA